MLGAFQQIFLNTVDQIFFLYNNSINHWSADTAHH